MIAKWTRGLASACARSIALAALVASCRGTSSVEPTDGRCPQSYEFSNHGCARVVVRISGPDGSLPSPLRHEVFLRPVRSDDGWNGAHAVDSSIGSVRVDATLFERLLPGAVDTVSVWVIARLRDQSVMSWPQVAADSMRHVLRFKPVGAVASVDSLSLQLRRP